MENSSRTAGSARKRARRTPLIPAPRGLAGAVVVLSALGIGAAPVAAQGGGGAARVAVPQQRRLITLSFAGADAVDVLRAISLQSGINIAVTAGARSQPVTVRLRGVSVDEAVRLVTQAAGFGFRRIGSTYLVGPPGEIKRSGAAAGNFLTTFALKNLTSAAAKTLIEGALPLVTVQTAAGTASVVLTGPEPDVIRAQRLLSATDVATPPAPPVSLTVTPTNVAAGALADVLRRAVPGLTIEVQGNTAILNGPQETISRAREIIASVDTPAGAGRRIEIYNIKYSSASALVRMLSTVIPGLQATPSAEPYVPPAATLQTVGGVGGSTGGGFGGNAGGGLGGSSSVGISSGLGSGGGGNSGIGSSDMQSGTGSGAGGTAAGSSRGDRARSLILIGRDTDVDAGLRLVQAVDIAPAQVEIEARIIDLSLPNTLDVGIQWGGNAGAYQSNVTVAEQDLRDILRFGRFARTNLQSFSATLSYLETRGRSKTLANPRISVIDNEEASIFIGEERRFQSLAGTSATVGQVFTVNVVPVGIALLVRPRVNNETGEITMSIQPTVSTVTSLIDGLPQTASRTANTTLRVRDGETIVIGGLISDQETKSIQQVPLLGNIPIIGELFRRRINSRTRSEILLFLTPRLLRDNGAASAAAIQERLPDNLRAKSLIPEPRPKP